MTKLPDEIEDIVKKISIKIWHLKNDDLPPLTAMEQFDTIIIEHLGKYLTIPTDEGIEKEEPTLHDLLGKAFVLLVNNPQNEDDHELLPHLERWLESNSIETHGTGVREVKPSIKDTIEKIDATHINKRFKKELEKYDYSKKKRRLLTDKERLKIEKWNGKHMKIECSHRKEPAIGVFELGPDNACSYLDPMIINTSAVRKETGTYKIYV